jgi:hypothetical protein
LIGLRELMLNFDYRRLQDYEHVWRRQHGIADGEPSTLVRSPSVRSRSAKLRDLTVAAP